MLCDKCWKAFHFAFCLFEYWNPAVELDLFALPVLLVTELSFETTCYYPSKDILSEKNGKDNPYGNDGQKGMCHPISQFA